jgi:hypothetical protein
MARGHLNLMGEGKFTLLAHFLIILFTPVQVAHLYRIMLKGWRLSLASLSLSMCI